jgi:hypothetical protein
VDYQLAELKKVIVKTSQPFFDAMLSADMICSPLKFDDDKSRREKIRTLKRLVNL